MKNILQALACLKTNICQGKYAIYTNLSCYIIIDCLTNNNVLLACNKPSSVSVNTQNAKKYTMQGKIGNENLSEKRKKKIELKFMVKERL